MDPEGFTTSLFRWDQTRPLVQPPSGRLLDAVASPPPANQNHPPLQQPTLPPPAAAAFGMRLGGLEGLLGAYGIRYYTAAKIAELGFTASTLVDMKEEELDDMMNSLSHIFRWELLVGERYGIKAAVRAERRRLQEQEDFSRRHQLIPSSAATGGDSPIHALDALSQEGLSKEPPQQEWEAVGSSDGGGAFWETTAGGPKKKQQRRKKPAAALGVVVDHGGYDVNEAEDGGSENRATERQREHPFIVTEPGEMARGKKNGLDYLFHLYDLCRVFLFQVQIITKERGEKCPTKLRFHKISS